MLGRSPLLAVCGTRPEVVKLAPVIQALQGRGRRVVLVLTGQHPDLAPIMMRELGLVADHDLGVRLPGATPSQLMAAILSALAPCLAAYRPALVIVQGDTVSTLAGALAAAYAAIPVAHVEAGLRTHDFDEPHPEELHRTLVAPIASLHFAPTRRAAAALKREGVKAANIHITGNSGIDALCETIARLDGSPELVADLARRFPFVVEPGRPLILATIHRRENLGHRMREIAIALARLAAFGEAEIILPLHPSPAVQAILRPVLEGREGVHLLPPVDHATMVWMMRHARLLLTDSGGLQEEAPALGLRTLVLRRTTERSEAISAGAAELVALEADRIVEAVRRNLRRRALQPAWPFGNGRTSALIASIVENWLGYGSDTSPALSASG